MTNVKSNAMTREQRRIVQCVRLAREQFDNIRQDPRNAREYSLIRREAMQDARYWRKLSHNAARGAAQ